MCSEYIQLSATSHEGLSALGCLHRPREKLQCQKQCITHEGLWCIDMDTVGGYFTDKGSGPCKWQLMNVCTMQNERELSCVKRWNLKTSSLRGEELSIAAWCWNAYSAFGAIQWRGSHTMNHSITVRDTALIVNVRQNQNKRETWPNKAGLPPCMTSIRMGF